MTSFSKWTYWMLYPSKPILQIIFSHTWSLPTIVAFAAAASDDTCCCLLKSIWLNTAKVVKDDSPEYEMTQNWDASCFAVYHVNKACWRFYTKWFRQICVVVMLFLCIRQFVLAVSKTLLEGLQYRPQTAIAAGFESPRKDSLLWTGEKFHLESINIIHICIPIQRWPWRVTRK